MHPQDLFCSTLIYLRPIHARLYFKQIMVHLLLILYYSSLNRAFKAMTTLLDFNLFPVHLLQAAIANHFHLIGLRV